MTTRDIRQEFFPKDPKKTYGLMELMKGTAPLVSKGGPEDSFFSWPHLLILEVLAMLGITFVVILMSIYIRAPLREIADPDKVQLVEKAPWYFLNIQELLKHMNPALAGVVVPNIALGLVMAIPYIDRSNKDVGVWFAGTKGAKIAIFGFLYASVIMVGLVLFNELFKWHGSTGVNALFMREAGVTAAGVTTYVTRFPSAIAQDIVVGQAIPCAIIFFFSVMLGVGTWKIAKGNTREIIISLFSAFVAAYFVLMIIGLFFRGESFQFISPFDLPPGAISF